MAPTFVENALLPQNGNTFNGDATAVKLAQKVNVKKPVASLRFTFDHGNKIGSQSFSSALIIHEGKGERHGGKMCP
ncbi:hypothetical protein A3D69_02640 [Candidatus Uhrbacteria bacterium RIFCSPHIGHO2_02_FULL_54_11]|nr:MAG: hypothetical protein A3D69_02640 [Candidatus Uhrbacteria bacterium RIFCSPHIGHO2_02_FULL_54_11]